MTWIKESLWVPDGMADGEVLRPDVLPHIIFAPYRDWWFIRDEITVENPDYVVYLKTLLAPMYGHRIRSYEIRLGSQERMHDPELLAEWEQRALLCRVASAR